MEVVIERPEEALPSSSKVRSPEFTEWRELAEYSSEKQKPIPIRLFSDEGVPALDGSSLRHESMQKLENESKHREQEKERGEKQQRANELIALSQENEARAKNLTDVLAEAAFAREEFAVEKRRKEKQAS